MFITAVFISKFTMAAKLNVSLYLSQLFLSLFNMAAKLNVSLYLSQLFSLSVYHGCQA